MASILDLARMHDSGDLAGGVSEIASVPGVDSTMVTAVRTAAGQLRLIAWRINDAGPVTRLGDSGETAGAASDIDIAKGARFVVACRDGSGHVKLISWDVDDTGAFITRAGDSGNQAGGATQIRIVALSDNRFVVACRIAEGNVRLITWRLNDDGSLARLADSANAGDTVAEIALCGLSEERAVTAVRTQNGNLKLIVWEVSANGELARLGDSGDAGGPATLIRAVVTEAGMVLTSIRDGAGNLQVMSWEVTEDGSVNALQDSGHQAAGIEDNALVALPDGIVSAVRIAENNLKLIAWSVDQAGTITRRGDSAAQAGTSSHIQLLAGPDVAGANGHSVSLVTAVRTDAGNLKLITWGPPLVRLHFKILSAPTVDTALMLSSMQDVYANAGISVVLASTENLNLPLLNDLDVGVCTLGNTTVEQQQLFANRNDVQTNEVAVYFVRSTNPPFNGCAAHPDARPAAVVAQGATQWTLGHEVGHVLGLLHVDDSDRLMTGGGTANITNLPPDLIPIEQSTMIGSALTIPL